MIKETMEFLSQYDPEVGATIEKEYHREQRNIELIASENIVSPAVMMAMGTCLTNKYAEGYPGKRYYGGCYCVDETEEIARQRACKLFGAEHANVQPHSGASANLAAFKAMLQPGDTFMGMNLAHGGHLSHGSPVNISGQYFHQVPYSLNDETEMIDYDEVYRIAQECKPKMILAGASAYPRKIDFAKFREIADSVGAFFIALHQGGDIIRRKGDLVAVLGAQAADLHQTCTVRYVVRFFLHFPAAAQIKDQAQAQRVQLRAVGLTGELAGRDAAPDLAPLDMLSLIHI